MAAQVNVSGVMAPTSRDRLMTMLEALAAVVPYDVTEIHAHMTRTIGNRKRRTWRLAFYWRYYVPSAECIFAGATTAQCVTAVRVLATAFAQQRRCRNQEREGR